MTSRPQGIVKHSAPFKAETKKPVVSFQPRVNNHSPIVHKTNPIVSTVKVAENSSSIDYKRLLEKSTEREEQLLRIVI